MVRLRFIRTKKLHNLQLDHCIDDTYPKSPGTESSGTKLFDTKIKPSKKIQCLFRDGSTLTQTEEAPWLHSSPAYWGSLLSLRRKEKPQPLEKEKTKSMTRKRSNQLLSRRQRFNTGEFQAFLLGFPLHERHSKRASEGVAGASRVDNPGSLDGGLLNRLFPLDEERWAVRS